MNAFFFFLLCIIYFSGLFYIYFHTSIDYIFIYFNASTIIFQLDLCQKVAKYLARTSAGFALWFSLFICMDISYFSNHGADHMGVLADCNIGPRHNWACCGDGWHCSSTGILFNYAMVENTMAKLKYVALIDWFNFEKIIMIHPSIC